MKKLVLGALLAAVAIFVWGFLFWATPLSAPVFKQAPDEAAVTQSLAANLPATGTYYIPDPRSDAADFEARHQAGPLVTIFYREAGTPAMTPTVFLLGFLHMFISMLLAGLLLRLAAPALRTYGSKVVFVVLAGVAVGVWGNLGDPIWYYQPWTYHLMTTLYDIIAWGLGGLILARFVQAEHKSAGQYAGA